MLKTKFSQKFNWFWMYYSLSLFSFILIVALVATFFINQILIAYTSPIIGQELYLGFYNLKILGTYNEIYINWISILLSILTFINICLLCLMFYLYKWSNYEQYFKKYELSIFIGVIIFFLLFMIVINFMNRSAINFKNINFIDESWKNSFNSSLNVVQYNYVFDLVFHNIYKNEFIIGFDINYFGILWIVIISLFIVTIFGLFIKIEYYKNKFYLKVRK